MSRRLPSSSHNRRTLADKPYQEITIPTAHPTRIRHYLKDSPTINTSLTDETDTQYYYDYYYQEQQLRNNSDGDGSGSLNYDYENDSCKRYSRNTQSEHSFNNKKIQLSNRDNNKLNSTTIIQNNKDVRRVYPNQPQYGIYQEMITPFCDNVPVVPNIYPPRRAPISRLSDRPQSSMSSGVTSAIADGCGGKCETFENVCYFFLQLVFMMGILIGVSLCIAGLVLRKSAARNLQVLVYIGILLAIVSALLLGIQWNARTNTKKRKLAVRNAKRAPIPLETLNINRGNSTTQQPLILMQDGSQRIVPVHVGNLHRPLPQRPNEVLTSVDEQQGIPWWRRKNINGR